jgi:Protein of unknown function (DUF2750)
MSQSSLHANAFYKDVAKNRKVWGIRDKGGVPAPKGDGGKRAMPFWSTIQRAQKVVANSEAYSGFDTFELSWDVFRDKWLVGLEQDGLLVGVNWSGQTAVGYDVEPATVKEAIEFQMKLEENA